MVVVLFGLVGLFCDGFTVLVICGLLAGLVACCGWFDCYGCLVGL